MRSGLTKIAVAVTLVTVVAGCADKEAGTATSATTPTDSAGPNTRSGEPSGPPPDGSGAPKVEVPLDATRVLSQPCAALSPAQLKAFNITKPGTPHLDGASGPGCDWRTDEQPVPRSFDVFFITGNKNGLSDTYRGGRAAFPGYFEPTEVDGYPAVFNDLVDGRAGGACHITVGISDTLAFAATEQADRERGAQSCDGAKQFAASVLKTLKEG